jgi:alkylhydroperoxidase family enzyme
MTNRFTSPALAAMTDKQQGLYKLFATGKRAQPGSPFSLVDPDGRLQGPPAAWVLVPGIGHALERLGGAMRYELTLEPRAREIAILLVGHHHQSPFELHAHTRAGKAAGLTDDDLAALADGRPPELRTEQERVVHAAAGQLLRAGTLDEAQYAAAVAVLGPAQLFELVTLIGYYNMLAVQLSVFNLLPPGHGQDDTGA